MNYGTPDQELYAIVYSFKQWRHYLEGSEHTIEVLSDHANLQAFMKTAKDQWQAGKMVHDPLTF